MLLLVIILIAAAFAGGYLVGSKNPLASVKAKIVEAAQKAVKENV